MKPNYDTTLARIAGNIAAGLVGKADSNGSGQNGAEGIAEWMRSVTMLSVGLARAIVEEVKLTEPLERFFCTNCGHSELEHETKEYRGDKTRSCLHWDAERGVGCGCQQWRKMV